MKNTSFDAEYLRFCLSSHGIRPQAQSEAEFSKECTGRVSELRRKECRHEKWQHNKQTNNNHEPELALDPRHQRHTSHGLNVDGVLKPE